ncbi:MAG: ATP-binding protein [Thermoanaerobaculum sp.]|nr:ATP-binding protein [Thermoanaerobaculum sp.]MDW7966856.1 ATP-binding protein [Thermoanaerobaculum sp.]
MKRWRRSWLRWRRQARFLVGVYVVLVALGASLYALIAKLQRVPAEELTNRLLVLLLTVFDLTLMVVVVFVLLRSLFKLLVERRLGIIGSRFRMKLLLSYLLLILVPALLISALAASLFSHLASSWFSPPVEAVVEAGAHLAEGVRRESEDRVRRCAQAFAARLAAVEGSRRAAELERLHFAWHSHLTALLEGGTTLVELQDPKKTAALLLPPLTGAETVHPGTRVDRLSRRVVVRAWVPLLEGSVVVCGEVWPEEVALAQGRLAQAAASYQALKLQRPAITATLVLSFAGIALVVVFAAVWTGLYLSRSFTEPLLALAATTAAVAEGAELSEVPVPGEDEVALLVASFNSMVRRLQAQERELRATVARLDAVLASIRAGILWLDPDKTRVRGNPAAAAMLACPALAEQELPLQALAEGGLGRLVEVLRSAASGFRGSLTVQAGGILRHVEVTVQALGRGAEPAGWVVALEDLTQLLRAQRQAAWSEVARQIAHQIKNPLTPIRLAAERIARHFAQNRPDLDEVIPAGCRAIVDHVRAMQELLDAFARYAKLPAVQRRPVDGGELLRQVVRLYQGVKPGVEVKLEADLDQGQVWLDPELFRQVLINLLDNAVEASTPPAEVTVRAFWEGDEVVVEVLDRGPGLPVEDPELLFQPFFSSKGRGSGVGLAVVLRIVTDHGGTVRLLPRDGGGVRAVVRVPGGEP